MGGVSVWVGMSFAPFPGLRIHPAHVAEAKGVFASRSLSREARASFPCLT